MRKSVFYDRLFSFISFLFLSLLAVFSVFVFDVSDFKNEIIRTIFIVFNCISAVITFFTIFKYKKAIHGVIYYIEGFLILFCGHPLIAIFFYFIGLFLFFTTNCSFIRTFLFNAVSIFLWFLSVIINTVNNLELMFIAFFSSIFIFSLYFYSYQKLERIFIPELNELRELKNIPFPIVNSKLYLSKFDLKEVQKKLLYDYIVKDLKYKELAEKHFLSISTVKSEMSSICEYFSCESADKLKKMLSHFDIRL